MQRLCHSLLSLVCRSHQLRHLSLGLTDIFDGWQNKLLYHLQQHRWLRSLHLGSLRSDPVSSRVPFIDNRLLRCFQLTRLGLDLNQISEDLVAALARAGDLKRLSLLVHDDVTASMPALGVRSWGALGETGCQVTVTMVHSSSGVQHYRSILQPSLPLSNLRLYFCQRLPAGLFEHLCANFAHRLLSLRLVDSLDEAGQPSCYCPAGQPDPLVMLTWLCPGLEELCVYGYCLSVHTIIGLASLRRGLWLEVPECCLYLDEGGDAEASGDPYGKISQWLGYSWAPVPDSDLCQGLLDPACSCLPCGASEEVYIESLLNEQDCRMKVA